MPEQLGSYVLDKRIGAGGMADVFLARGPQGVCVIKRPHSHLCANAEFLRLFLDEASLLAQLNHPGIARIFELGHQNGVYYLAMEYVPGFDLMTISLEHERQGEYIAPELAAKVVADAAAALHYAHQAVSSKGEPLGIVHRDVSPHNILLDTEGAVKVIDFGVARAAKSTHRTEAGLVRGKYPYMSPEQITGQSIDCRTDVYALGLVLYELLTNVRAIAGDLEEEQIANARVGRIKPVEQLRPNIPSTLRLILSGALHPQPEGRYRSAAALAADLEAYIVGDRHVVGREDLLRLFRVVAAETSHVPTEFQPPPSDALTLSTPDETLRPGSVVRPAPDLGGDSSHRLTEEAAPLHPVGAQAGKVAAAIPLVVVAPNERVTEEAIAKTLPRRGSKIAFALAALVILAVGGGGYLWTKSARTVDWVPPPELTVDAPPEVAPVPFPAPEPEPVRAAVVQVVSRPPMEVLVDNQSWGVTPLDVDLMAGKYTFLLQNLEWGLKKTVVMTLGKGDKKNLEWIVKKGKIVVRVEPFGNIAIDGRLLKSGSSLAEQEVWEGRHTVRVSLKEPSMSKTITREVEVAGNETAELTINMLTDEQ